jgi:hypothetical protein
MSAAGAGAGLWRPSFSFSRLLSGFGFWGGGDADVGRKVVVCW